MSSSTVSVGESSDNLVPEVSEVTTFLKVEGDSTNPVGEPSALIARDYGDMPVTDETIQTILSRPIRLAPLSFSSSSTSGTVLSTYRLPTEYFQNSSNALAKLVNFQFLQCDVVFELHANGSPTNAGLLMLVEIPQMNPRTTNNLRYWSSFPNKSVMDLGSAKDGVLKCVFKHYMNWSQVGAYNAAPDSDSKSFFDFGLIKVIVLSAYAGTGASSAITLTPWMKLENVRVKMPTLPVVLPSAKGKSPAVQYQGAPESVAKVANVTVNAATTVTGAMRSLGHLVASKPNTVEATRMVKKIAAPTGPHATSLFPGVPLAMDAGNNCPPRLSSTNIRQYCEVPYIQNSISWSATAVQGSILGSWDVSPCSLEPGDTIDSYQPGPLDMAALMFSWWRGDIAFKPQFAKNAFVSGKLQFIFVSGDPVIRASITSDEANQVYSWVVDIRAPDVPEMVINFVSPTPWRPCIPSFTNADGSFEISASHTGILYCVVVNPLVSGADSGLTSIDMHMWKRGLNMEFAYPCQRAIPFVNGSPDTADNIDGSYTTRPWPVAGSVQKRSWLRPKVSYQGAYGGVTEQSQPLFPGGSGISEGNLDTMGERVQDFKELALRMCWRDRAGATSVVGNAWLWRLSPFFHSWGWLYLLRHMFAYMHGSLRYQLNFEYAIGSGSSSLYPGIAGTKQRTSLTWAQSLDQVACLNTPELVSDLEEVVEVTVPWYSPTHFAPTNAGEPVSSIWPKVDTKVQMFTSLSETCNMVSYTSAGDDFAFALQIAPPEVQVIVSDSGYEVTPPSIDFFTFD